jgi:Type IV secretion system pilin
MPQKLYQTFITAMTVVGIAGALFITSTTPVSAQNLERSVECGSNVSLQKAPAASAPDAEKEAYARACGVGGNSTKIENVIKTIINILSAIVGAVSIIMIIIGGFKYITSSGDSNNVSSAKNTIIYALVGLIIVAFAQVIVQFVLERT